MSQMIQCPFCQRDNVRVNSAMVIATHRSPVSNPLGYPLLRCKASHRRLDKALRIGSNLSKYDIGREIGWITLLPTELKSDKKWVMYKRRREIMALRLL